VTLEGRVPLRTYVELAVDLVAPRAELEAFETDLLAAWWHAGMHTDMTALPQTWRLGFEFWRRLQSKGDRAR
jgi:hypothetical protein